MPTVNVHYLITRFYNVRLNEFIAKYSEEGRITDRTLTGGFMVLERRKKHQFEPIATWLNNFRSELYKKYNLKEIDVNDLIMESNKLALFFQQLIFLRDSIEAPKYKELERKLFPNLNSLFKDFSEILKNEDYKDILKYIRERSPVLKINIMNKLGKYPVKKELIVIDYRLYPEFKEHSKKFRVLKKESDSNGSFKHNLIKGVYEISLPKRERMEVIDLKKDVVLDLSLILFWHYIFNVLTNFFIYLKNKLNKKKK